MNKKIWVTLVALYAMILALPMTASAEEATIKSFSAKETMAAERVESVILDEDSLVMEEPVGVLDKEVEFNSVEYLGKKGVELTWNEFTQDGLSTVGYILYRYEYDFETETIDDVNYAYWIVDAKEAPKFYDTTAEVGKVYYYAIVGLLGEGNTVSSITSVGDNSIGAVLVLEKPQFTLSNVSNAIKVSWNKVPGADGYIIYRKKSGASWTETPYKYIEDANKTYFNNSAITAGQGYYYRVTAYMDDPAYPEYYWETDLTGEKYIRRLKAPTVTVTNAKTSIKVAWDAVAGATGYEVYRDGVLVKTTTSKSWFDYNKIIGKKYVYTVKAYYKGGSGVKYLSQASAKKTIYRVPQAAIKSLTKGTKKFTVKYGAVSKATGYQITYSRYSDFRTKVSKTTTSLSRTVTGLTANRTYYVKVRAYKTVNGVKYYGQYSTVKKITVK